ncbi:MAG: AAA family ATPase [Candidatus Woesearchaeota archaeon]|nr:AAA family ATPase [Candidatus Woesearchaeota archaeon]
MTIALCGSLGTGKSTVLEEMQEIRPDWVYFKENVRHQTKVFGYKNPWEIEKLASPEAFELMNMNSFSVIDPEMNPLIKDKKIFIDGGPANIFAYYLLDRKTPVNRGAEEVMTRMGTHYAGLIKTFVYFPIGAIPLVGDGMRPDDPKYQKRLDQAIEETFKRLKIPTKRIHLLRAISIEDRVKEIMQLVR